MSKKAILALILAIGAVMAATFTIVVHFLKPTSFTPASEADTAEITEFWYQNHASLTSDDPAVVKELSEHILSLEKKHGYNAFLVGLTPDSRYDSEMVQVFCLTHLSLYSGNRGVPERVLAFTKGLAETTTSNLKKAAEFTASVINGKEYDGFFATASPDEGYISLPNLMNFTVGYDTLWYKDGSKTSKFYSFAEKSLSIKSIKLTPDAKQIAVITRSPGSKDGIALLDIKEKTADFSVTDNITHDIALNNNVQDEKITYCKISDLSFDTDGNLEANFFVKFKDSQELLTASAVKNSDGTFATEPLPAPAEATKIPDYNTLFDKTVLKFKNGNSFNIHLLDEFLENLISEKYGSLDVINFGYLNIEDRDAVDTWYHLVSGGGKLSIYEYESNGKNNPTYNLKGSVTDTAITRVIEGDIPCYYFESGENKTLIFKGENPISLPATPVDCANTFLNHRRLGSVYYYISSSRQREKILSELITMRWLMGVTSPYMASFNIKDTVKQDDGSYRLYVEEVWKIGDAVSSVDERVMTVIEENGRWCMDGYDLDVGQ